MSTAVALGGRTFASLRKHRNYRLYFVGQGISITGTWVQNVGQAWLVLELAHSAAAVGVLAACQFGPYALFGLLGGAIVDRLDNRRVLIATQAVAMGLAAVLAVLALSGTARVWEVDLVAALYGTVLVLDTPARQAFTMEMVGREELPNAVALNSSIFNASRIVGPAIGGLVIAAAGVGICFVLNAASYVAVLACLVLMDPRHLFSPPRRRRPASLWRDMADGIAFARGTTAVRLVLVTMLVVATVAINFNVVLPVLASHTLHRGAEVFGVLSACFGAGALAGALLSASLGRASWPVLFTAGVGLGIAEVLLAPQRQLPVVALLLVVTGACFSLYTSNSNSTLQLATPDALRGRVLALYSYSFFGTAPLGGLLAGWLTDRGGTTLTLLVGGATAAATVTVAAWRWHRARRPRRGAPGATCPVPVAALRD